LKATAPIARLLALLAIGAAAILAALLLLGGGTGGYSVNARFQNASQLVKGNLVQVGGQEVGKVENIDLTSDGQAEITMSIDSDHEPLRRGTRAIVRQASLSGVASRYVDLTMPADNAPEIPDGGVIDQDSTTSAVDLDQRSTRRSLPTAAVRSRRRCSRAPSLVSDSDTRARARARARAVNACAPQHSLSRCDHVAARPPRRTRSARRTRTRGTKRGNAHDVAAKACLHRRSPLEQAGRRRACTAEARSIRRGEGVRR
jgi:hypothetical protein